MTLMFCFFGHFFLFFFLFSFPSSSSFLTICIWFETHLLRYCKSKGVLAGVPFFNAVFAEVGCSVEWSASEGDHIDPGAAGKVPIATVKGKARHLLIGERTALNIICRSSGIASKAAR